MATPDKPLTIAVDLETMTLNDLEIFETFTVKGFKFFMARFSNWTPDEVGGLTFAELRDVAGQIAAQIKVRAVPKVS